MHFRTAQEAWTPTDLQRAQDTVPTPANRERDYIRAKIREHEAEIARRADQIRLLRLELESRAHSAEPTEANRCAGQGR